MRTINQDGQLLAYRDLGPVDGPAILLVHGLMSDGSTWSRPAAGLAEAGYRVIVPDLLGHGSSDKPADGGYHLPYFAASLHSLLTELGVRSVTVVGHSLGGAIAMQLAHDHPELVHRLVLVSAGGLGRQVHPMLRVATLPGAHRVLRLVVNERTARAVPGAAAAPVVAAEPGGWSATSAGPAAGWCRRPAGRPSSRPCTT